MISAISRADLSVDLLLLLLLPAARVSVRPASLEGSSPGGWPRASSSESSSNALAATGAAELASSSSCSPALWWAPEEAGGWLPKRDTMTSVYRSFSASVYGFAAEGADCAAGATQKTIGHGAAARARLAASDRHLHRLRRAGADTGETVFYYRRGNCRIL